MKVFNLRCASDHVFEGWFASEAEFTQQQAKGWLSCPLCDSTDVVKGLSAPHLARKSNAASARAVASVAKDELKPTLPSTTDTDLLRIQQALLAFSRHVVANTEDVGSTFADVARQMHDGEAEERPIRGTATPEERKALADDGIDVMPLLLPEAAKHGLQ
jgi:hypothetical protein